MKRNAKGSVKAGAVQQYIEQELEVHLSIVEAEKSLEELMEYRFVICTAKVVDKTGLKLNPRRIRKYFWIKKLLISFRGKLADL